MSTPGSSPDRRRSPRAARRRADPALLSGAGDAQDSATLARRAAELARPLPVMAALPTGDAAVVALLGGQRLGFPSRFVQEAVTITEITPLPGLPAHVLGLANIRSRVLPVFTLLPLFRLPAGAEPATQLLLIKFERGEFAVPIDQLEGIQAVDPASLQRSFSGAAEALVLGVADDGLLLLDVPALAAEFALSDDGFLSSSNQSP